MILGDQLGDSIIGWGRDVGGWPAVGWEGWDGEDQFYKRLGDKINRTGFGVTKEKEESQKTPRFCL